jgi:hypothetical protein
MAYLLDQYGRTLSSKPSFRDAVLRPELRKLLERETVFGQFARQVAIYDKWGLVVDTKPLGKAIRFTRYDNL